MIDKNGDGIPDQTITIDGVKVNTKDLFPDASSRLDFHTKLKLLKSPASGEPDGMPAEDSISDKLFSPPKKKAKAQSAAEQEPDGMQGLE